jgi:hypothetical protein
MSSEIGFLLVASRSVGERDVSPQWTAGKVWASSGKVWACNSGHSRLLVVTRGHSKVLETLALSTKSLRAGDGDRTRMASLEGWSSTIELHPHVSHETRKSLDDTVNVEGWKPRFMTRSVVMRSFIDWSRTSTARSSTTNYFDRCIPRT